MIVTNRDQYRLCLIDTNIISEVFVRSDKFLSNFKKVFHSNNYFPCFSIFSIMELRQRKFVYDQFLDFFSKFPCMILKNFDQMIQDEFNFYPNSEKVCPILLFSPGNTNKGSFNLKESLNLVFSEKEIIEKEFNWNSTKTEILDGILGLKKNYPPKGKTYTQMEIRDFIEMAGFQHITIRNRIFAEIIRKSGNPFSIDYFPSIKMVCYLVFYKFYVDQRQVIPSDTFDLIISSVTPYVDAVITEKNMAEIFRKIQKQDVFLKDLEIYTLKNLY